MDRSFKEKK